MWSYPAKFRKISCMGLCVNRNRDRYSWKSAAATCPTCSRSSNIPRSLPVTLLEEHVKGNVCVTYDAIALSKRSNPDSLLIKDFNLQMFISMLFGVIRFQYQYSLFCLPTSVLLSMAGKLTDSKRRV